MLSLEMTEMTIVLPGTVVTLKTFTETVTAGNSIGEEMKRLIHLLVTILPDGR